MASRTDVRRALRRGGLPAAAGLTEKEALRLLGELELAAVDGYHAAQALPFLATVANPVITAFLTRSADQHQDSLTAIATSSGVPVTKVSSAVSAELGLARTPADLSDLIAQATGVEQSVMATAVAMASPDFRTETRALLGRVATSAGQRLALLRLMKALVAAGRAALVASPPTVSQLPDSAGSVAFPIAFIDTTHALDGTGR